MSGDGKALAEVGGGDHGVGFADDLTGDDHVGVGPSPSISKRLNMCVPPPRLMFLALSGGSVAQCPLASCRVAIAALRVRLALVEAENLRVASGARGCL